MMKVSPSVALLTFVIYVVFTGSATLYDLLTGAAVSVFLGVVAGRFVVKRETKAFNPMRWFWSVLYFIKYMTIIEIKAHLAVIKALFTGKYRPGIVRVPLDVKTGYAKLLVASSITNTPGTVVVDISDKYVYVNWINVVSEDPVEAKKHISLEFEKYAKKIFD